MVRLARIYLVMCVAVVAVNAVTLFRGYPPPSACGRSVEFFGAIDRFQNCDSPLFNRIAQDFAIIFTSEGMNRQARPGFMALGWLMDRFLQVVTFGAYDPYGSSPPSFESAEIGYIFLNVLLLAAAATLFVRLVGNWGTRAWGATMLGVSIIIANPVTRAFMWTAHTQILNILVPIVTVWLLQSTFRHPRTLRNVIVTGLILGAATTVYGLVVVAILSLVVALALTRQLRSALVFLATSAIVPVAWWLLVRFTTGGFFSPETTDFRQFIWVADGLREGTLIELTRENVNWILVSFADAQTFLALALMTVIGGAYALTALRPDGVTEFRRMTGDGRSLVDAGRALAVLVPVQIIFYFAMGFYQTRLSWGLIISVTVGMAIVAALAGWHLAGSSALRRLNALGGAAAGTWLVTWILIPGPWH